MSWSVWEREIIRPDADVLIVGGGITGLSAAWFLKAMDPHLDVLVLDRSIAGTGASTRNAGFACMGSLGELVDDEHKMGVAATVDLYRKRWEGLQLLTSVIPDHEMDLHWCGGYELFFEGQEAEWSQVESSLPEWNERIRLATGITDAFTVCGSGEWGNWKPPAGMIGAIRHSKEGRLHSGKMVNAWLDRLVNSGVRIQSGVDVKNLDTSGGRGQLTDQFNRIWTGSQVLLATNAFTSHLIPDAPVRPARNQVLVTSPLKNMIPDACFHVEQGYIYFRRYGDRLLIGGARNKDPEGESTDRLLPNDLVIEHLVRFAEKITGSPVAIDFQWSGIIGVGPEKWPIVNRLDDQMVLAARLSGMGVALGSAIGRQAARLILGDE